MEKRFVQTTYKYSKVSRLHRRDIDPNNCSKTLCRPHFSAISLHKGELSDKTDRRTESLSDHYL